VIGCGKKRIGLWRQAWLAAGLVAAVPAAAAGWTLVLAEATTLPLQEVRIADVVQEPVPQVAGRIVLKPVGRPGSTVTVSRQLVLRHLVTAGLAAGVELAGAERCQITFAGQGIDPVAVAASLKESLAAWLPESPPGAPPAWCELESPVPELLVAGDWRLELTNPRTLVPGRNLVGVRVVSGEGGCRFSATVIGHFYGEVARAMAPIAPETVLTADLFTWEWQDLSRVDSGLAVGRQTIAGKSARRSVAAGRLLRQADVKVTPLVLQGDPVDLVLRRGVVTVTVRAVARQEGRHGQIITVRNGLTGKLVTGRVAAPGLVEWRR